MSNVSIGKKNNQSSVSDADQEIPTLGPTDNAGNSFTSFPALSVYPRAGISRSVSYTADRLHEFLCLSVADLYVINREMFAKQS